MHIRKILFRKIICDIHIQTNRCYSSNSLKILFFGSDEFSLENLKMLNEARISSSVISSLEVVTSGPEAKTNPIQKYSSGAKLPMHRWPYVAVENQFDLGVVASFGHLLPEHLIKAFPWGMINVHGSILPRWRGASPVAHAILNGDTETGVTIMKIEPHHFDIGDVLAFKPWPIEEDITTKQLTLQLAKIGAQLLLECLQNFDYYINHGLEQDSTKATKAPKLNIKMSLINWNSDAVSIYRQYRAISETFKLQTQWRDQLVKIHQMILPKQMEELEIESLLIKCNDVTRKFRKPGQIYLHKKRNILCVRCKDNWTGFKLVTVAGSKSMNPQEFYNGFLSKVEHAERIFNYSVIST